ncbi:MAG: hypothetical protein KDC84_07425 [Crocinitomicaceae bacterium]|nr:hypothetical protein [Crocinitomicaceae bacterium]
MKAYQITHILLLILLLQSCGSPKEVFSKDEEKSFRGFLEIEGFYQGKDLFVQNPYTETNELCAYKILLNGQDVSDSIELHATAFQIDFKKLGLSIGDSVNLKIYHHPDCLPKILNSEVH